MVSKQMMGSVLATLLVASFITTSLAAAVQDEDARKFNAKPNNVKKQQLIQPDVKQEEPAQSGFQWGDILGYALQILVGGPTAGPHGASDKMDYITQLTTGEFSWTKVFSLGLELILRVFGGNDNAAIDKMDSGSPVEGILTYVVSYLTGSTNPNEVGVMVKQANELLGLVMTLLDALRTSFSQRAFNARLLGNSDPLADAAVTVTTMMKSYIKSYNTEDDICTQKYLCEANFDCAHETGDSGYLMCQMANYLMSLLLEHSTFTPFEIYNDAGRRGRIGEDCYQIFSECNDA
ncbi:hypothetical protein SK128_012029 [Halocaridina rubra]|uniref:Secreted protein n=1 Tax=Halocaridina rubra TaxID=373956 RepID=A0AAN8XCT6_HALRR